MSAFDAPNREMCTVRRGETNTPLQALVTLNDTQFVEAARVFAADILRDSSLGNERSQLISAFRRVTSRSPQEDELELLSGLLGTERQRFSRTPDLASELVGVGEWPVDRGLNEVEHAAWIQVATLLFNLSETLSRQ